MISLAVAAGVGACVGAGVDALVYGGPMPVGVGVGELVCGANDVLLGVLADPMAACSRTAESSLRSLQDVCPERANDPSRPWVSRSLFKGPSGT